MKIRIKTKKDLKEYPIESLFGPVSNLKITGPIKDNVPMWHSFHLKWKKKSLLSVSGKKKYSKEPCRHAAVKFYNNIHAAIPAFVSVYGKIRGSASEILEAGKKYPCSCEPTVLKSVTVADESKPWSKPDKPVWEILKGPQQGISPDKTLPRGPVLEGSLTGEKKYSSHSLRPVYPAVAGFYVLMESRLKFESWLIDQQYGTIIPEGNELGLRPGFRWDPDSPDRFPSRYLQTRILYEEFAGCDDAYGERLSRNFFDYLTLAALGEATYARSKGSFRGDADSFDESSHSMKCQLDPRKILPLCEAIFEKVPWGGGYGGEPWARIAKAAMGFFSLDRVRFIDSVVDLSHHGGLAFNKGMILQNPPSITGYRGMLTHKTRKGLLDPSGGRHAVPHEVLRWVQRLTGEGVLPRITHLDPVKDVTVPILIWGTGDLDFVIEGKKAKETREFYPEQREVGDPVYEG